jgi:lysophospholipase L1-like esterase
LGLVAGSLLTFPAAIPWMIALWLSWHTWSVARHRPAWPPLAGCLAILLIKRTPWAPALVLLGVVMLAAAVFHLFLTRVIRLPRLWEFARATLAAVWITWAAAAIHWYQDARCRLRMVADPTRPVVCLGDSLTAGTSPGGGYPQHLATRINLPVVNLGQDGITSADALKKLPTLIEANPQLVVVELGGHDYLKGFDRAATRANLEEIIGTCRRAGAEVILLEIPRGFITDPYAGLERDLARRWRLELISDTPIRKLILFSPHAPPGIWLPPACHLSDDGLHPNARGERFLAEEVARSLARVLGT